MLLLRLQPYFFKLCLIYCFYGKIFHLLKGPNTFKTIGQLVMRICLCAHEEGTSTKGFK